MNKKKIVALVPLKANSERVPGKNFRQLGDRPLFAWIIDTLLSVADIDQVVINTDARSILAENGLVETDRLKIRDRKPELCGDFVSMNLILEDDIHHCDADIFLMTHVTNPFISAVTVQSALDTYVKARDKYDSLFSVNKIQSRFYREDGSPLNHDPDNLIRTQDLPPLYEENSCLYLFTSQSFDKTKARIGQVPMMYPTPLLESIDIDNAEDWYLAEALARQLIATGVHV